MTRFSHLYDLAFSLESSTNDGSDVTPAMLRAALSRRIKSLPDDELFEACGLYDTDEVEV